MIIDIPSFDSSLVYLDSSIKTTRYALQYMIGLNESIAKFSGSKVLKEAAIIDIEKLKKALSDYEHLLMCLSGLGDVSEQKESDVLEQKESDFVEVKNEPKEEII